MPFVAFKGEKNIADVTRGIFGDLKAGELKRASAALVEANPHLADLKVVSLGAAILIPRIPGLPPIDKPPLNVDDLPPLKSIHDDLSVIRDDILGGLKDARGEIAVSDKLYTDADVAAQAQVTPEIKAFVDNAASASKERTADLKDAEAIARGIDELRTRLAEMAKRIMRSAF
jgi:hypothetical protein